MKFEEKQVLEIEDSFSRAVINCKFTSSMIDVAWNTLLSPYNLSLQQYNVISLLVKFDKPISVTVLKNVMVEKSPNITRLLDKMCAKGWVERGKNKKDARCIEVVITEKGRIVLHQIEKEAEKNPLMENSLTNQELDQLNSLLNKLRTGIKRIKK